MLAEILALPRYGSGIGLARMHWMFQQLGQQVRLSYPHAIKVTGSNGKGSTAAFLSSILQAYGLQIGLYTSPHLQTVHERIRYNGRNIESEEMQQSLTWFLQKQQEYLGIYPDEYFSFFEAFTAAAFHYYAVKKPRLVVWEAGMGGRYDPTRIVPTRIVVLTSVDLEHTVVLGKTEEQIAYDKIDLCPEGGVLLLGNLTPHLNNRVLAYCQLKNLQVLPLAVSYQAKDRKYQDGKMHWQVQLTNTPSFAVETRLLGDFQIENAGLAICAAQLYLQEQRIYSQKPFVAAVQQGLANAKHTGRLQQIHTKPNIYWDAAHTPKASQALFVSMQKLLNGKKVVLIYALAKDKDLPATLAPLLPLCSTLLTTDFGQGFYTPKQLRQICQSIVAKVRVLVKENIDSTLTHALTLAKNEDCSILLAGSVYLLQRAQPIVSKLVSEKVGEAFA
ncbi:MAG: Mur ligase family protein [Spirochaetota bacterium]